MPNNYVLLEKITVGSAGASSVTFANIPQTGYTDLVVKMSARAVDSANNWYLTKIQFNTDTTSGNYSARIVGGFGSSAFSSTSSNYAGYVPSAARTANTFGNNEIYIPNYTASTQKSYSTDTVTEGNGSSFEILGLWAGLWTGTAAINQIVLSLDSGNLAANSTFYLYGVAKLGTTPAIAPKATGGDIVMTDGTYWYHAFRSSGTFTPATSLSCDVLVVAGGGGAGSDIGGGGGAGGVLGFASQALSTNQTITIGAGGAGATTAGNAGTVGSNSVFGSLTTAVGGGRGSGYNTGQVIGGTGGSGGGGNFNGPAAGGSATSGQGNAGGAGGANASGGGGGYGAVGANGGNTTNTKGANGGAGNNTVTNLGSISTWLSVTGIGSASNIAGGGGSGTGGTTAAGGDGGVGGGGTGGTAKSGTPGNPGTAGVANTGGGGGGGGNAGGSGGTGGSGVVIVRYLVA